MEKSSLITYLRLRKDFSTPLRSARNDDFFKKFHFFVVISKILCIFAMFLIKNCDEKLVIILIRVKKNF